MTLNTKGPCAQCSRMFSKSKASSHLLQCIAETFAPSESTTEGYLICVSSCDYPSWYWMFITVPKDFTLKDVDYFLRDIWLECCGHMSAFYIGDLDYSSYPMTGDGTQSMNKKMGQILSPGLKFTYTYDMGSSTDLKLDVVATVTACPDDEINLIMRNDPPAFLCEICNKSAETICTLCGGKTCKGCNEKHSCVIKEDDTYMLSNLVNSPRTGVCGYECEYE
ncbi:Plasmid pRiA4b ORF-3 family protein [Gigaspora margarita]|uniref:Plasmid pRiA4b ORF-3 family protein n=1 Tax=Gigaspora margarita TaxID=4874 RepID=A0A8H4EM12_GIGMA|nr:Plasmid pRiA4b ORF-3 family protein [Gigaspora margarita]